MIRGRAERYAELLSRGGIGVCFYRQKEPFLSVSTFYRTRSAKLERRQGDLVHGQDQPEPDR
jgi:hypothetical protein